MVAAYSMDKELATFLGRPPRICRQYCDIQLPLDISWEDLVADDSTRVAAVQQLDPDGWNVQGDPEKDARPRVALLASILREMVLEFSLSREVENLWYRVKSRRPSRFSHFFWIWFPNRSGQGVSIHLTIFDFSYIGLPAAAVLSKSLLRRSQSSADESTSEKSFPQSEIIQRLSVFAAHIETFFSSRESDYDTCMKGLSYIQQALDFVLSPRPGDTSEQVTDETREGEDGLLGDTEMDFMTLFGDLNWEQELRPRFT
ncbi:hypothetical protein BDV09DRAFT_198810 [Aspergillus tetrazonus]